MSGPQAMTSERFGRVCPQHRCQLVEDADDLWCPSGHRLYPTPSSGLADPFECWDFLAGRRYAVVRGDSIWIDGHSEEPLRKLADRDERGMVGVSRSNEQRSERRRERWAATRDSRGPEFRAHRLQLERAHRERQRACREGREPAEWARLRTNAQERRSA